jgi:hypothetical protein
MKTYNGRLDLAKRYKTTDRNVDILWRAGKLPPPDIYRGRSPLWSDETLDEHDRAAAIALRASRKPVTTVSEHTETTV